MTNDTTVLVKNKDESRSDSSGRQKRDGNHPNAARHEPDGRVSTVTIRTAVYASNLEKEIDEARSAENKYRALYSQLMIETAKEKTEKKALAIELERTAARVRELEKTCARWNSNDNDHDGSFRNSDLDRYCDEMDATLGEKDGEIDSLRKELADEKEKHLRTKCAAESKINELEKSEFFSKEEYESTLFRKNARIALMKEAIQSQQDTIRRMGEEMDQLQRCMGKVTETRKDEAEETQSELMDTKTECARLQREIARLQMELEESELKRSDERSHLENIVLALKAETPSQRRTRTEREDQQSNLLRVKIQELKSNNRRLEDDCQDLRMKLSNVEETQKSTAKKPSRNDKWRNVALKEKIHELRTKVKELEGSTAANQSPHRSTVDVPSKPTSLDSPRSVAIPQYGRGGFAPSSSG